MLASPLLLASRTATFVYPSEKYISPQGFRGGGEPGGTVPHDPSGARKITGRLPLRVKIEGHRKSMVTGGGHYILGALMIRI